MAARVTQADVAHRLGVHTTTVSLALRNSPSIAAATRERIQKVANEMGYQPDPALSALMAYRTQHMANRRPRTIAYVTNWDTRLGWQSVPAQAQYFNGASRKAAQLGYQLEHFWLGEPGMKQRRMSEILYNRNIPAVVLASHRPGDEPIDFDWSRFSTVRIDSFPRRPAFHSVTNHHAAMIRLACRRASESGYRRIGLVMPRWWDEYADLAWSAGFLAEQLRTEAACRVPILYFPSTAGELAFEEKLRISCVDTHAFRLWHERHRPDVVISCLPFVQRCFEDLGLNIPRDLAFIDLHLEGDGGPLAGIRQSCERLGEIAIELLAAQVQQNQCGIPTVPTATYVEGCWTDGASLPVLAAEPALS